MLPENWIERSPLNLAQLSPLQKVEWTPLSGRGVHFYVKRDELLHPAINGNKAYKLLGHLRDYSDEHNRKDLPLASFGGAYSNHLYALAAAAAQLSIPLRAYVRGEASRGLSPCLADIESWGCELNFLSRQEYRERHRSEFLAYLSGRDGDAWWVPEGGAGPRGRLGTSSLLQATLQQWLALQHHAPRESVTVCTGVGTGTFMAGMINGLHEQREQRYLKSVMGVAVLQGGDAVRQAVCEGVSAHLIERGLNADAELKVKWSLETEFHDGGYAKVSDTTLNTMLAFEEQTGIQLEPVYTAKVINAIRRLAEEGRWQSEQHVIFLHSGGLQGRRGFAQRLAKRNN